MGTLIGPARIRISPGLPWDLWPKMTWARPLARVRLPLDHLGHEQRPCSREGRRSWTEPVGFGLIRQIGG